jgi:hypothetical protein
MITSGIAVLIKFIFIFLIWKKKNLFYDFQTWYGAVLTPAIAFLVLMMHLLHLASSSQLITLWAVEMMRAKKVVGSVI